MFLNAEVPAASAFGDFKMYFLFFLESYKKFFLRNPFSFFYINFVYYAVSHGNYGRFHLHGLNCHKHAILFNRVVDW